MIQREEIKKALLLRLVSDYLEVPKGTKASVDDVAALGDDWWFTVRFNTYQPITPPNCYPVRRLPQSNRSSLRLWEKDLALFDLFTDTASVEGVPSITHRPDKAKLSTGLRRHGLRRQTPHQLSLFPSDEFE